MPFSRLLFQRDKMRNFDMLLLFLLLLQFFSSFPHCLAGRFPISFPFAGSILHQMQFFHHPSESFIAQTPSPSPQALAPAPSSSPTPRRRGHHRNWHTKPNLNTHSPSGHADCGQTCVEPLTSTIFGSPCGCVIPMKVHLLLSVAPFSIFPVTNELEIEIAAGIYLKQEQVKIMGASADSENQGKTVVEINLVPLGEKFDKTTAILIYARFRHKKVPLNVSLFGDYEVIYINYPGLPSSPSYRDITGNAPTTSAGGFPITANFGNRNSEMGFRTIAILCLSGVVLILALIGVISIVVKWKKSGKSSNVVSPAFPLSGNKRPGRGSMFSSSIRSTGSESFMSSMAMCALSVKTFTRSELEKATDKFSAKRILGEGGFGRVYHGTIEDGIEVAVKLLTRNDENRDREFIAEIEMLSRLHHRNLVKLIGICIEGCTRCLVYELVHNGSLESHLHGVDKEKAPLDWEVRLKIALGAARGLAYLHEDSNPRVIHRDFKASNVLLEEDFTPKVSDFGLAREATEGSQHISTRVMGTFGYVAPEYAMTGHLLVKSDVYSYGVVLLELLTGRKPVDMSQPAGEENLVTWARPLLTSREGLEQLADPALAGTYEFEDMAKVAAITSMCVDLEVTHRPFMGEVVQALKLIYKDEDETCVDCCSLKDSSVLDSEIKGDDGSWWNATPRLTYGQASSFVTMEYNDNSSGQLEEVENSLANRSGPLRPVGSRRNVLRLGGSRSEDGGEGSRRFWAGRSNWL